MKKIEKVNEIIEAIVRNVVANLIKSKSHYAIANIAVGDEVGEILFLLYAESKEDGERVFNVRFCPTENIKNELIDRIAKEFNRTGAIAHLILNGNNFCNISKVPIEDWLDAFNNDVNMKDMPYIKFVA